MRTFYLLPVVLFSAVLAVPMIHAEEKVNTPIQQAETSVSTDRKVDQCAESTLSCLMSCPECSIFAKAVHESGLEDKIAAAKNLTIFVPTNKAFESWSKQDLDELFKCKAALSALVLNHLCPKSLSPEKLLAIKKAALCCHLKDAEELIGKERAQQAAECCKQMKEKHKMMHKVCDKDGKPCLGSGCLCDSVKKYPTAIVQCNNGYVYAINKVQVPRGLKVYRELTAEENAENAENAEPAVVVEEVEISASVIPENAPNASASSEAAPADQAAPAADNQPKNGQKQQSQTDKNGKNGQKKDNSGSNQNKSPKDDSKSKSK